MTVPAPVAAPGFKKMTEAQWQRRLRRCLIVGDPNSRKTTSLATFPRPSKVVIVPGEKGAAALPPADDLEVFAWDAEAESKIKAADVLKGMDTVVTEILTGKHGPCTTIAIDGLHKYFSWIMAEVTGGASVSGDEFEPKLYARAYDQFLHFLTKIDLSPIQYAVFTAWSGKEPDSEGSKQTHVFPDFPGKMAKRIMGEFGVVVYAEVGQAPMPGKPAPATWQLQPEGRVWGCGLKLPPSIAAKLPVRIAQDWNVLDGLIQAEIAKTKEEGK